jgi:hypothetical protein
MNHQADALPKNENVNIRTGSVKEEYSNNRRGTFGGGRSQIPNKDLAIAFRKTLRYS